MMGNSISTEECKISYFEKISSQAVIEDYLNKQGFNSQLIKEGLAPETKVSVVIPAYNETGVITRCLQALNKQSCSVFEVVVVDNGSTDETLKEVKNFREYANYPLHIIEEPIAGVATARKRGMDEVLRRLLERNGEFRYALAVTDADTIPPKEWIERIIGGFNSNEIGGLAGTHGASKEVEEKIYKATGIKNYFNVVPQLIEFIERRGVGRIKMSGPNSAFIATAYALGGGIKQEFDSDGKPKLREVNNLGNRIRKYGYKILPMGSRVIKDRRRELFEIINNCDDSYFPEGFSANGRFNVIRGNEVELLDFACRNVSKEIWEYYRYKMIYKVLRNFVFQPLASGEITEGQIQELFAAEEISIFLSIHSSSYNFPNNQDACKFFRNFLSHLEEVLQLQ